MLSLLLLSFHLSLPLFLSHLLQMPTLSWWTRWLLCPWVTQRTLLRFWRTRMCLGILGLMFVLHSDIIKIERSIPLLSTSGVCPCLLVTLVLFLQRVLSSSPGLFPHSLHACTVQLLMSPMLLFTTPTRISFPMSELFLVPHLLDIDKKEKKLWDLEMLGVILCCFNIFIILFQYLYSCCFWFCIKLEFLCDFWVTLKQFGLWWL